MRYVVITGLLVIEDRRRCACLGPELHDHSEPIHESPRDAL
jgi:hypothetical protein